MWISICTKSNRTKFWSSQFVMRFWIWYTWSWSLVNGTRRWAWRRGPPPASSSCIPSQGTSQHRAGRLCQRTVAPGTWSGQRHPRRTHAQTGQSQWQRTDTNLVYWKEKKHRNKMKWCKMVTGVQFGKELPWTLIGQVNDRWPWPPHVRWWESWPDMKAPRHMHRLLQTFISLL